MWYTGKGVHDPVRSSYMHTHRKHLSSTHTARDPEYHIAELETANLLKQPIFRQVRAGEAGAACYALAYAPWLILGLCACGAYLGYPWPWRSSAHQLQALDPRDQRPLRPTIRGLPLAKATPIRGLRPHREYKTPTFPHLAAPLLPAQAHTGNT